MNFLGRSLMGVVRACVRNTIEGTRPSVIKTVENGALQGSILNKLYLGNIWSGCQQLRQRVSLQQLHKRGPYRNPKNKKKPLGGNPFLKGIVLRPIIKKPKKPNSANRKCVLVKLSNGKEMTAHVPGIGHNLQEHNVVLCRVGRLKDTPGVKIKCVRGKFDLPHVIKSTSK